MSLLNQLAAFLKENLKIEDETFAEYALQILKQDDMEEEEKLVIIKEFLQEAAENAPVSEIDAFLVEFIKMAKAEEVPVAESVPSTIISEPIFEVTREQQQRQKPVAMSRKDREGREKLLAKYGYETEDIIEDENGELDFSGKSVRTLREDTLEVLSVSNKDLVKQKELQKRMEQKKRHEEEAARNRANLEKQKLQKEQRKKGSVKQERKSRG